MIHQLSLMLSYRIGAMVVVILARSSGTVSESSMLGLKGRTKIGRWLPDHHILKYDIDSKNNSRTRGVYLLIFV